MICWLVWARSGNNCCYFADIPLDATCTRAHAHTYTHTAQTQAHTLIWKKSSTELLIRCKQRVDSWDRKNKSRVVSHWFTCECRCVFVYVCARECVWDAGQSNSRAVNHHHSAVSKCSSPNEISRFYPFFFCPTSVDAVNVSARPRAMTTRIIKHINCTLFMRREKNHTKGFLSLQ